MSRTTAIMIFFRKISLGRMILHFASAKKWNVRETFFFNQIRVNNPVITSSVADFRIGEAVFEVGGRSKGLRQIQGVEQGYIVKGDIEFSSGNILSLWWFGLN